MWDTFHGRKRYGMRSSVLVALLLLAACIVFGLNSCLNG